MQKSLYTIVLLIIGTCISSSCLAQEKLAEPVSVEAEYPGGYEQLLLDVSENFEYTKEAREKGIEGRIVVQFSVTEEGKVDKIKVKRGLGYGLDEAAIKAVSMLQDWVPGRYQGRAVRSYFSLPIRCSIPDDEKQKKGIEKSKTGAE